MHTCAYLVVAYLCVDKFDVFLLCVMGGVPGLSYVFLMVSFWALAWDFL